jgi:hypothetical protein
MYDSLVANLPSFDLKSTLSVEDGSNMRIVLDPRSGDYLTLQGSGDFNFSFDRTGNVRLSGIYRINRGVYRLSFYDLVKKSFDIAPGSSVSWSGNLYNGDLNIRAIHNIRTSSLSLIGHEIGENEKNIYRRTLPYQVGINITGQIEKPQITFSLDLPNEDKNAYPALASKLSRLNQPEFETELNKQVFALLVLGGFLPETTGPGINESVIATTAIANSVNGMLANQLNNFAGQYVKGFDIDVGMQSYSDYSTGGGRTRTSMDFRVSKKLLDDRLTLEAGGSFDVSNDQSGPNTGQNDFRGDIAVIYDLTESGNKKLKAFNNETYDIIYQEIRNTGIALIFIKEFDEKPKKKQ